MGQFSKLALKRPNTTKIGCSPMCFQHRDIALKERYSLKHGAQSMDLYHVPQLHPNNPLLLLLLLVWDLNTDKQLRQQLVKHLEGGEAFTPIDDIIYEIPFEKTGVVPEGLPYSLWQQFYHLRFAQLDILDFSRNANYKPHQWPTDYWPKTSAPGDKDEWDEIIEAYFRERNEFTSMISNPENSLLTPFPHGTGQTLLREALLIIEHTAYHTGEMLVIMRILGLHS